MSRNLMGGRWAPVSMAVMLAASGACASGGGSGLAEPGPDAFEPVGLADFEPFDAADTRSEFIPYTEFEVIPYVELEALPEKAVGFAPFESVPILTVDELRQASVQTQESPPENVRLTFHIIEAGAANGPIDPSIAEIVTELRQLFRFDGYRLLSNSVMNASFIEGAAEVSQRVVIDGGPRYMIEAALHHRPAPSEGVVVNTELSELLGAPQDNWMIPILGASVSLADGQTAVLGSGRLTDESPVIILAVTASFNPGA